MTQEQDPLPEEAPGRILRLDEDGLPILDDVVGELAEEDVIARLKAELMTDLEPRLQAIVRAAFAASVKVVALELKRTFERELDEALEARLQELVAECVDRAYAERG
jgi:hypothetical protein